MVGVEDDHLRRATRLPAALDDAGEGVEALHEGNRPGRRPAAGEQFLARERKGERLVPVPEPYLKSMPSVLASPRMLSIESCTELMKHAEHCGCVSTPTLNQTGRVEGRLLAQQQVGELGVEGLAVRLGGEVAALLAPAGDGVDHARHQLADARLALGVPRRSAEVLAGDDVGGQHRPGLGDLDIPRCSKTTLPSSPLIEAVRSSHAISSAGSTPGVVK